MYSQIVQNALAVNSNCGLHLRCMAFELHVVIFFSLWELKPTLKCSNTVNEFQCHFSVGELHNGQKCRTVTESVSETVKTAEVVQRDCGF